jgi:hypothetical protein
MAKPLHHLIPLFPIDCIHPYLDQLVVIERQADFFQDRRGDTGLTDDDHGLEFMRPGAEFPYLMGIHDMASGRIWTKAF